MLARRGELLGKSVVRGGGGGEGGGNLQKCQFGLSVPVCSTRPGSRTILCDSLIVTVLFLDTAEHVAMRASLMPDPIRVV